MNPAKKSSSKLHHENQNKELRKSPKRRTGKAAQILEEPRRILYTYHEGSENLEVFRFSPSDGWPATATLLSLDARANLEVLIRDTQQ
jgi:hypothetical protein